jgi:hypothetical protein
MMETSRLLTVADVLALPVYAFTPENPPCAVWLEDDEIMECRDADGTWWRVIGTRHGRMRMRS